MKPLSNSDKLRAFIAPNMADIIKFIDKNGKCSVYTGGYIHGIYRYLDMIGAPTTLTNSGQRSNNFSPSSSIKNDTVSVQPVIADLRIIHKSICECCGRFGHKSDARTIRGPKFLPPSIIRNMNQFNALHGDEPK